MSTTDQTSTEPDTAHALSTLTEEERAAMAEELSEDERAALAAVAAAGGDDDEEDEDSTAAAPAAAPAPAAAAPAPAAAPAEAPAAAPAPAAEAPAAAPAPAPAAEPAPAPAPRPRADGGYRSELPADYQDRVSKLKADSAALDQRFEDGEIDRKVYREESAKLLEQRDELNALRVKAEISTESRQQSLQQQWMGAVGDLYDRVRTAGGVDYEKDEARRNDLDGFIKALANNPANEDKPMAWFLDEAHRRVQLLHGEAAAAPAAAPAPATSAPAAASAPAATAPAPAAAKPAARTPPEVPANLAHVPGGDAPGDTGDEFADLDQYDGEQLEAALARMSPDKRARYLAGA